MYSLTTGEVVTALHNTGHVLAATTPDIKQLKAETEQAIKHVAATRTVRVERFSNLPSTWSGARHKRSPDQAGLKFGSQWGLSEADISTERSEASSPKKNPSHQTGWCDGICNQEAPGWG
jgi:hypothetical protein